MCTGWQGGDTAGAHIGCTGGGVDRLHHWDVRAQQLPEPSLYPHAFSTCTTAFLLSPDSYYSSRRGPPCLWSIALEADRSHRSLMITNLLGWGDQDFWVQGFWTHLCRSLSVTSLYAWVFLASSCMQNTHYNLINQTSHCRTLLKRLIHVALFVNWKSRVLHVSQGNLILTSWSYSLAETLAKGRDATHQALTALHERLNSTSYFILVDCF